MNKMINPRSGHGPAFGFGIIYLLIALIIGWPLAIPFCWIDYMLNTTFGVKFGTPLFEIGLGLSTIIGTYIHYKIWYFVISWIASWFE